MLHPGKILHFLNFVGAELTLHGDQSPRLWRPNKTQWELCSHWLYKKQDHTSHNVIYLLVRKPKFKKGSNSRPEIRKCPADANTWSIWVKFKQIHSDAGHSLCWQKSVKFVPVYLTSDFYFLIIHFPDMFDLTLFWSFFVAPPH